MKFDEQIKWLASVNSGNLYPQEFEDIDKSLPYFKVSKNNNNKYNIDMFNYMTHDNAPRMQYVCDFLSTDIFPHINKDISGYYSIQLHDTYTYLNDGKDYTNVLCFGKNKIDKGPIVIPDCYFIGDWAEKYHNIIDLNTWENKQNKIIFAGTTTGSREPKTNQRIQTCLWGLDKPICDFYITNVAQISPQKILNEIPYFDKIYRPYISLEQQMSYRYILNIDGNTVKWNPDFTFTKSLGLSMPSNDMLWYSTLLQDNIHYKEVDLNNILSTFNYYENNEKEALNIVRNANTLAKQLFKKSIAINYMIELFDNIAENK